ncbi:MAG: bifunctional hydroxymethylpyrimidine kinase/phosphomethylpyrimidine kinase [Saprospiraceae bacterium]|nr:bifunctional hydroxymethylpyrimidine kinase/phosphomethylpyrimidine kinase [Saprospiraceae bacterium]
MSLLTVGTVAFDSIETPFGKVDKVIGGAATYICWAASYFCDKQDLVSVIGDDWPVDEIKLLNSRGVDTRGLQIKNGEKSFFWAGKYREDLNQRDTLVTELNVLADFDPVLPESYQDAEYLMLGNLTPEIQMAVIRQMEKRPRLIAMDTMNFWMDVAMESLLKTIKMVDVLTINDEEARQLSGEYSLVKAAKKIFDLGPKYLVIKKGEHGALLFHGDEVFFAPALPLLEVRDPTGAGDTFAGGFMGYIANTNDTSFENLKRALIYGSAMASFCVEEFSLDRLKRITPEELQTRMTKFKNLVHYTL